MGPTELFCPVAHMCEKRLRAALRVHLSGDITMFSVSTQSCLAICRVNRARGSGPPPLLARRLPTHPASWMAPQFWGSVVFVLHLERLPGPGARVHVQQPGILEQLQERRPQQGSGAAQAMNHARAGPRPPSCTVGHRVRTHFRRQDKLPGRAVVPMCGRWPGTRDRTQDPSSAWL